MWISKGLQSLSNGIGLEGFGDYSFNLLTILANVFRKGERRWEIEPHSAKFNESGTAYMSGCARADKNWFKQMPMLYSVADPVLALSCLKYMPTLT